MFLSAFDFDFDFDADFFRVQSFHSLFFSVSGLYLSSCLSVVRCPTL